MHGPYVLPIGLALVAASLYAVANGLHQLAASKVPVRACGPVRLMLRMLGDRHWWWGSAAAGLALALQATALRLGGLILIQTVLVSGLIMALFLDAARRRRLMRAGELAGAVLVSAGAWAVLAAGRPLGSAAPRTPALLVAAGCLVVVVAFGLAASRVHDRDQLTGRLMGAAAGACFALDAVFLKAFGDPPTLGPGIVAVAFCALGFTLGSLGGNVLVQRAYQRARLAVVLPALASADPLVALAAGRLLLGERVRGGVVASAGVGLGMVAIVLGIALLRPVSRSNAPAGGPPDPVDLGGLQLAGATATSPTQ